MLAFLYYIFASSCYLDIMWCLLDSQVVGVLIKLYLICICVYSLYNLHFVFGLVLISDCFVCFLFYFVFVLLFLSLFLVGYYLFVVLFVDLLACLFCCI